MLYKYPEILTSNEVREILQISKNTLYYLIRTNQIPAFRLGSRSWRFRRSDLEDFLRYHVEVS